MRRAGRAEAVAFYPPRESLLLYHGGWGPGRLFLWATGTARFELPNEDAARLRAVARHAAILSPNHPTAGEGALMYLVGHRLNLRYLHCTALETFGKFGPLGPRALPGCGCFSIRRGVADYPAFKMARTLLAARRNLVLFPEGEISGLSDRLLPLERGNAHIAFWGLEALRATDPAQPLYLVPLAVKHRETGDAAGAVRRSLTRLENALRLGNALRLPSAAEPGALGRLHRIETAYLASVEAELGLPPGDEMGVSARWDRLRAGLEARAAALLGCPAPPADATRPQRARALLDASESAWRAYGPKGPVRGSDGWRRLKAAEKDVVRLHRFLGFEEGYVAAWPSVERFGDVLRRFEEVVLGRHGFRNRRIARLRVGEPINIAPLWDAYRADRKGTVARVTSELEARMDALLQALVRELTTPWPGAHDDGSGAAGL